MYNVTVTNVAFIAAWATSQPQLPLMSVLTLGSLEAWGSALGLAGHHLWCLPAYHMYSVHPLSAPDYLKSLHNHSFMEKRN